MRLFRPRNLIILTLGGVAVAVVMSKKNRPADPLPTVTYNPPPRPAASEEKSGSGGGATAGSADKAPAKAASKAASKPAAKAEEKPSGNGKADEKAGDEKATDSGK